jgi:hypothetical protein
MSTQPSSPASYPCPKNGCASSDPDWCSECGANMHPAAAQPAATAPASAATAVLCPDCGTPREGADQWCGVCRYNFTTGQSFSAEPIAAAPSSSASPPAPNPVAAAATAAPPADDDKALPGWPKGSWSVVIDFDPSIDPTLDAGKVTPRPQLTFPLDLPEMRIGRKNGKDHPELPIDDEAVSSRHAKISFTADGEPVILDLASTNGTSVNGAPATAGLAVALKSGDQITLGRWTRITIRRR